MNTSLHQPTDIGAIINFELLISGQFAMHLVTKQQKGDRENFLYEDVCPEFSPR